ncbi:LOW QUALITY PROTEIN: uncharacterized protein LOC128221647 [Mya arenaria]|uniref:LOW QUALITY PROTEIN: uncharacterized protein LOC128221647 n=1 Tax=Mya arenaria TaxID=6604 RepID=UPI0022E57C84|nr:LOW QUALITY PROTEIN: uncharacterized protein LOC128221647 [Mya arenaria]
MALRRFLELLAFYAVSYHTDEGVGEGGGSFYIGCEKGVGSRMRKERLKMPQINLCKGVEETGAVTEGPGAISMVRTTPDLGHTEPGRKLVVEMPAKIEDEYLNKKDYRHRPSKKVVLIKWITTLLLFVLILGFVNFSKISFISIANRMFHAEKNGHAPGMFIMLQIVAATVVCLLESVGITFFIFKIPGITKPVVVVLLMMCVFIAPIFYNLVISFLLGRDARAKDKFRFFTALVFEIGGCGLTGYLCFIETSKVEDYLIAPVAVLFLSISWTPGVQRYLLKLDEDEDHANTYGNLDDHGHEPLTESYGTASSIISSPSDHQKTSNDVSTVHTSIQSEERIRPANMAHPQPSKSSLHIRPSWKLTIYMSFLKAITIYGISMILFQYSSPGGITGISDYVKGWSQLNFSDLSLSYWIFFLGNVIGSLFGYFTAYIACTTCMQKFGFSIPLIFVSSPMAFALLFPNVLCEMIVITAGKTFAIAAMVLLVAAQLLSTGYILIRSQSVVMLKENQLFWTPMYNSALLEQWLMLVRKNEYHDEGHQNPTEKAKRSKIYVCTTMYREADYEMRQLLESIQGLNHAQAKGNRHFEAHVFFDGAVKNRHPTKFVLQLVSLVETVLGVGTELCTKMSTPYGILLSWTLKAGDSGKGMVFCIHLKDNVKVKNKKRWSQVMYMSYVLDFQLKQDNNASEEDCFILTTDADVRFTPDSVEALLDLMIRDNTVGAVCARTHPLGSGPLVWYQVFEYAIGHWFQKAAEHVIGSVLCSPGCFSVYRCRAIRDILPKYATNVEQAFEFLTKDMGEDRWFCTLLVQSGWRIEYCAASENSTHCPEDFDEFFKQRRRWVASTLANLMLLIKEWSIISKLNPRVSIIFLVYQAILLFATLIGPSSIILVVTGGLKYAWNIGVTTSVVLQVLVTLGYVATCLLTSSKTQLNVAKLLTFLYAVIMSAGIVGTAVQVAKDFSKDTDAGILSSSFAISTTTLYLGVMVGIFLITGILHLGEFVFLLHGVWFFLCIPGGYLILMIYSISNITDRTWGTREDKTHSFRVVNKRWQDTLTKAFKSFLFGQENLPSQGSNQAPLTTKTPITSATSGTQTELQQAERMTMRTMPLGGQTTTLEFQLMVDEEQPTSLKFFNYRFDMGSLEDTNEGTNVAGDLNADFDDVDDTEDKVLTVEEWLPSENRNTPAQQELVKRFKEHGFENTIFISKMTEREIRDLGVKSAGLTSNLMQNIKRLPDYEIQAFVPKSVEEWLDNIGLGIYMENFIREHIRTSKDMEILKSFSRADIETHLKIKKIGHIKRLLYAISKLRNPTQTERKIIEVRERLNKQLLQKMDRINCDEFKFWDDLKNFCLLPQSTAYGLEEDLKVKLGDLRNAWLMVFAVSNTLWMVLIFTLANQGQLLSVAGSNPVGLVVLVLFSFVLLIQFLAMILHRIGTMTHFLGRAPYRVGDKYNKSWAFNDSDMKDSYQERKLDLEATYALKREKEIAYKRIGRESRKRIHREERVSLLSKAGTVEQV